MTSSFDSSLTRSNVMRPSSSLSSPYSHLGSIFFIRDFTASPHRVSICNVHFGFDLAYMVSTFFADPTTKMQTEIEEVSKRLTYQRSIWRLFEFDETDKKTRGELLYSSTNVRLNPFFYLSAALPFQLRILSILINCP
ncbi:unnamed protein product [Vicia faba]|uniref:Uncharacterized protein n=1 Tax=Vicia faba TaxID=3906 RepID=A0AAV1AL39_VICFA|nr:unnamed protein product [Vicia faba]